jgi:undecaprenyl diphosphate synthase
LSSSPPSSDLTGLDRERIPTHVAIIMDGNGRWAKKQRMGRINGHNKGADTVREIVRTCREIGVSYLTLYAFSTENWQRPRSEVAALMALLKRFLLAEKQELLDNNIRLNAIGEIERLPDSSRRALADVMEATGRNDAMLLTLALSYGGRSEIVRMVKEIATQTQTGRISPDDVTPELVASHLYTEDMPDPDLLIRTSGEFRISNFLLWQIAYSEIFVTDTLWPDFGKGEFLQILRDFQSRDRRFGKV